MIKYTQRQIKDMVLYKYAEDISHADMTDHAIIMKREGWLNEIGYSCGTYGVNGKLYQGHKTGKLYAITSRTMAIYLFD